MATQYTAGLSAGQVLTASTMNSIGAQSETFTPTWTSSGTAPAIGNGTLTGRYFRINKLVFVQTLFIAGSTTTYGTGDYRFALPVTARAGLYGFMPTGIARIFDSSANTLYLGQTSFRSGSTTVMEAFATGTNTAVGATFPMTFAVNDEISFVYWYEAA